MEKMLQNGRIIKQLRSVYELRTKLMFVRNFGTEKNSNEKETNTIDQSDDGITKSNLSGFAKAFTKFSTLNEAEKTTVESTPRTFASLLRHSNFIDVNIKCFIIL